MIRVLLIAAVFGCGLLQAETPSFTADEIMQRVGANQDRAEELRRQFVYKQHVRVVSRKTNGKVMQEEASDYVVVPSPQGSDKKLAGVVGKYWQNHQYVSYSGERAPDRDTLDSDLVSDLRDDLVNENRARDGIAPGLFPLTSKEQQKYVFRLLGDDMVNGRKAYRVAFRPKKNEDTVWKGEALIDTEEFQPVTVFTKPARHVPLWVRTALGTDLPDIGFSVTYKRQGEGLWFPVTFGTEFRLRAIFFINREITITLQNNDFERTHVDSVVRYDESSLRR
jgi:hypothetical protein